MFYLLSVPLHEENRLYQNYGALMMNVQINSPCKLCKHHIPCSSLLELEMCAYRVSRGNFRKQMQMDTCIDIQVLEYELLSPSHSDAIKPVRMLWEKAEIALLIFFLPNLILNALCGCSAVKYNGSCEQWANLNFGPYSSENNNQIKS